MCIRAASVNATRDETGKLGEVERRHFFLGISLSNHSCPNGRASYCFDIISVLLIA
jgi:hypothetical protein